MFHASADNIDDLMRLVFTRLMSGNRNNSLVSSRKGDSVEVFGALLELTNPRARLGRSKGRARVFSSIGELVWYLSGSNNLEQIQYYISTYGKYSDDGVTLNGAYGPRIFSSSRSGTTETADDEWQRVINTLASRPGSRNAIIQIYSNSDGRKSTEDIPCTCTMQFVIRKNKLYLHVHMRSNDAFLGLPHDIFSFTMLQEIAARQLGVDVGKYYHSVASLHLYNDTAELKSRTLAQRYLDEGLHETVPMPPMPLGDPWPSIRTLIVAEHELRRGKNWELPNDLAPYWDDLVTLLRAYAIVARGGTVPELEEVLTSIHFAGYRLYILDRIEKKKRPAVTKDIFEGDHE